MKQCFKCKNTKPLTEFYKHPRMKDGRVNKCRVCNREDNKVSNGNERRECIICSKEFFTTITEINRGGGNCCSRECWYKRFNQIVKRGEEAPSWKGDSVGKSALHDWVYSQKGAPKLCEDCETTEAKQYDWANISGEYKRDVNDFKRLCRACHAKFDYPVRSKKWAKAVTKLGWNVTKIKI